jgi:acetolactate synthase-1/2/3 large subunit
MFDAVTKFNACVETPEQLPVLLRQAFREATSGTPGPVHLDVPGHVGQTADRFQIESEVFIEKDYAQYPSHRPVPHSKDIEALAMALAEAQKPVIIAGGGVMASSAGSLVVKIAEKLSIPVATSMSGRGTIPDNHPLSVGVVGSYSRATANKIVSEADLVLFIGSNTGDMVTDGWKLPKKGTRIIQVDINPSELGRNFSIVQGIMGDAREAASKLLEAIDPKHKKTQWAKHVAGVMAEWRKEVELPVNSSATPIHTERLCKEITEVLPPDAILVADTGYSSIWTCSLVDLNHAGQTYIRAAGSLGWAFPASLGAKCAAPGRPVFCFTGDGGFFYHLCELETAARKGIKTITVVNNNSCMSQCAVGVGKAYGNFEGNKDDMFRFRKMDFAAVAQEFGCLGIRVENPEKIKSALQSALEADKPVLVDVVTDENSKPHFEPSY